MNSNFGDIEWKTDNSIFQRLVESIDTSGKIDVSAFKLSREDITEKDDDRLVFVPGLGDSIVFNNDKEQEELDRDTHILYELIRKISANGDKNKEYEFYILIERNEALVGIIDELLEFIIDESLPIKPFLFDFAKDLAFKTNSQNNVKIGIAILGLCQDQSVIERLKLLGLHDEFTVYTVVAILNLSESPAQHLWDVAKKVTGWGRIQTIERLAEMELSDEIKDWLVRDGYKNDIEYGYLAFTCAVCGELHKKLEEETIDAEMFNSAGDIIDALIRGEGDQHIITYDSAATVIENYVRHSKTQAIGVSCFLTLHRISNYVTHVREDIANYSKNGWTEDLISNCLIEIDIILKSRDWIELTKLELESTDRFTYWNAKEAAEKLGLDIWETVWKRLLQNPMDQEAWHDVTNYAKPEMVDNIINLALKTIPLSELTTGPSDSLGLGPDFYKHLILTFIITFLGNHPGKGEQLIIAGLNSPVTGNRNAAIRVLGQWGASNWSDTIKKQIIQLSNIEPNSETKRHVRRLLHAIDL